MRKKKLSYSRFRELCLAAIESGAQAKGNGSIHWDISGGCHAPYTFQITATDLTETQNRYIDLDTRCRKCPPCLKARAVLWRLRMETETALAVRTWLVTLTLSPEKQAWASLAAQHRLREREVLWHEIDEARRFRETCLSISPEITLWLKRMRERAQGPLRLCLVAERHKSGLPHFHALVHETITGPVRHRDITETWRWGFSQAKLVKADNPRAPAYVAKYLSKEALCRVRASRGYGQPAVVTQQQQTALAAKLQQEREQNAVDYPTHEGSVRHWLDYIASFRYPEGPLEETNYELSNSIPPGLSNGPKTCASSAPPVSGSMEEAAHAATTGPTAASAAIGPHHKTEPN